MTKYSPKHYLYMEMRGRVPTPTFIGKRMRTRHIVLVCFLTRNTLLSHVENMFKSICTWRPNIILHISLKALCERHMMRLVCSKLILQIAL